MQRIASQSIGDHINTETWVLPDGKTLHFFVNGQKVGEYALNESWNFPGLTQNFSKDKVLTFNVGDIVALKVDLSKKNI